MIERADFLALAKKAKAVARHYFNAINENANIMLTTFSYLSNTETLLL